MASCSCVLSVHLIPTLLTGSDLGRGSLAAPHAVYIEFQCFYNKNKALVRALHAIHFCSEPTMNIQKSFHLFYWGKKKKRKKESPRKFESGRLNGNIEVA